jgi:phage-related holin
MKTTTLAAASIYSASTIMAFICSYFFNLAMSNSDQYLALVGVVLVDGFFGIIAGTKREGFQTRKALKVLRTLVTWIILLTVLLMVEQGFKGTSWLSETILVPFIIFQLISALKNASMSGFIDMAALNTILDKIDLHKGDRK